MIPPWCPGRSAAASGPRAALTRGWCAADPGPPETRRLPRPRHGACGGPGSAVHHFALHCIRDTRPAEQQTGVAVGIEAIVRVDRMRIGALHHVEAGEGCD